MATVFGSPSSSFISRPVTKLQLSSSQQQSPQQKPLQVPPPTPPQDPISIKPQAPKPTSTPDSTDWIASTLTRRFGVGAGLAWAGFLAVGVVSEQIKTRLEVSQQEANTKDVKEEEVVLPNGIRYYEMRVGGGASPRAGDLVVIDLNGRVEGSGQVFVDTFGGGGGEKKPLALVMGSRPYSKGMCEGIEYALRTTKAGGKKRVIVPPKLGFGEKGADLGSGVQIPPNATLEFVVQLDKVSIAPA